MSTVREPDVRLAGASPTSARRNPARRRFAAREGVPIALAVLVLVVLVGVIPGRAGERALVASAPAPELPDAAQALQRFLAGDWGDGRWRAESLGPSKDWVLASDDADPGCVLVARADGGRVRTWRRERFSRFLVPGAPDLFFQNYRLDGPGGLERLAGRPTLHAVWVPRRAEETARARHAWIDVAEARVVRLEDRSHDDRPVRVLQHLGSEEIEDLEGDASCRQGPTRRSGHRSRHAERGPDLAALARRTSLPVLAPGWLPEGFRLVGADARRWPQPVPGERGGATSPRGGALAAPRDGSPEGRGGLELAYLVYSDGLAEVSLGIALGPDMDRLEEALGRMREAAQGQEEGGPCPTLPAEPHLLEGPGVVIRRRVDVCRTVLRVDGLHGVSVALLARNMLPGDAYVRMIQSLAPVVPAPAEPVGALSAD